MGSFYGPQRCYQHDSVCRKPGSGDGRGYGWYGRRSPPAFKSFDDHLIFECFNEPHGAVNSFGGGDAAEAIHSECVPPMACVGAIRGTGGNNATRDIMIQPIGASPVQAGVVALVVPNNDPQYPDLASHLLSRVDSASMRSPTPGEPPLPIMYTAMSASLQKQNPRLVAHSQAIAHR